MGLIYICMASVFSNELSPQQAFTLAKPQIDKALELDPDLPEARTWNGLFLCFANWDFAGAAREFIKAIEFNYPPALRLYSDFLQFVGRYEESLEIARRLQQAAPFFPHTRMIYSLYYTGQYQEAEEFAQTRLKIFSNYTTLEGYGFLKFNTGQYEEAITRIEQVMELSGFRNPRRLSCMGAAHARSGQGEKAREVIEELKAKLTTNDTGSIRFFVAIVYAALGEKEAALQWLQQAYEQHEMEIRWLTSEPQFYSLHGEPAFQELVESVGFPAPPALASADSPNLSQ